MAKLAAVAVLVFKAIGQDLFLQAHVEKETRMPRTPMANIRGAALNGLLQLEDWFFSWPQGLPPSVPFPFDEVASGPTLPQGRRFPSDVIPPELIDPWYTDGDLTGTTAKRIGDKETIAA